jgi:hypothetical protein
MRRATRQSGPRRSDALARRRELMDAWAWHCEGAVSDNIVTFKRQAMV